MVLFDTHCHLDQPQFDPDRDEVIARARVAGVDMIVSPATDLDSSRQVLDLAERYPGVYAAVGVHPNDCIAFDEGTANRLRELAAHSRAVAIGEIGLDYYWQAVPAEQQKAALRAQLAIAADLGLPVILHCRGSRPSETANAGGPGEQADAMADLLWELERWGEAIRKGARGDARLGVLHAFSGDLADAERAYDLGFLLSLGGPVTFKNARRLHALVPRLRPERLMLETDAPYLAPHPHRGQRNEPGYLPLILRALADLLQMAPAALAELTTETATGFFRLS